MGARHPKISLIAASVLIVSACYHDTIDDAVISEREALPCPPSGLTEHGIEMGEWRRLRPAAPSKENKPVLDAYNIEFRTSIEQLIETTESLDLVVGAIENAQFDCRKPESAESAEFQIQCETSCAFLSSAQDEFWYWRVDLLHNFYSRSTAVIKAEITLEAALY